MAKKNNRWSGGRLKDIKEKISRKFNGLPVVDAENDIRLMINADDISKAKTADFERCIFAQCCKRQYSSQEILLMRSVAYIELPDENGNHRVERFIISSAGKKIIKQYDLGELPDAGASFVFKAPSEVQTLEYNRKKQKEFYQRRKKEKKQAKMKGEISGSESNTKHETKSQKTKKKKAAAGRGLNKQISEPTEEIFDIRDGRGLIQMKRSKN